MAETLKEKVDRLRQEQEGEGAPTLAWAERPPIVPFPSKLEVFYDRTKKVCACISMIVGTLLLLILTGWILLAMCHVV